ncbi:MAG: hypothetical protein ACLQIB_05620 [Isosphaeraceae bacterium]
MTYHVVVQPRAERDIQAATLWILGQSGSRPTALRWARGLRAMIATPRGSPRRCPIHPDSDVYREDVRVLLHGKRGCVYPVFYRPVPLRGNGAGER